MHRHKARVGFAQVWHSSITCERKENGWVLVRNVLRWPARPSLARRSRVPIDHTAREVWEVQGSILAQKKTRKPMEAGINAQSRGTEIIAAFMSNG